MEQAQLTLAHNGAEVLHSDFCNRLLQNWGWSLSNSPLDIR